MLFITTIIIKFHAKINQLNIIGYFIIKIIIIILTALFMQKNDLFEQKE